MIAFQTDETIRKIQRSAYSELVKRSALHTTLHKKYKIYLDHGRT